MSGKKIELEKLTEKGFTLIYRQTDQGYYILGRANQRVLYDPRRDKVLCHYTMPPELKNARNQLNTL